MKTIDVQQSDVAVKGSISIQTTEQGLVFWRLPHEQRDLFALSLQERAQNPTGVRFAFRSDTSTLSIDGALIGDCITGPQWDGNFDLLIDGELHQRKNPNATPFPLVFDQLPDGEHLLELYLPQLPGFALSSLQVDDAATVNPDKRQQKRWITYGSSITHCGMAHGPSETWPALVARQFDLDLLNLGFGGECHLDTMVGRVIRDQPADVISMCLGINVQGQGSFNPRTFREAAIGLVKTVRDGHPRTPIAIMSPIFSCDRETTPNSANMTLPMKREMLREAVDVLQRHGDDKLMYVDGLAIFGQADEHLLPDNLHPDPQGYTVMATRFADKVMPKLLAML